MALLHRAEIRPTKLEMLTDWLPGRSWWRGPVTAGLTRVAGYRFDDPAGAVGIETLLVRAGDGPVHQVPLTYRDAPLAGADDWLVGTTRHSVLGPRWVYDACGDPVHAAALASAILTGAGQAQEYYEVDGVREVRASSMTITSSGASHSGPPPVGAVRAVRDGDLTVTVTDSVELTVVRRPGGADVPRGARLTGTWPGQSNPVPLAYAVPR
ncbi:CG0192-related protein [Micromonospora psammae]|uniref:CG0192-related protein n=1 Tax=Micromonospora sp. CPCC 205556 TaxID=3122398 RepID=UPI002FF1B52F